MNLSYHSMLYTKIFKYFSIVLIKINQIFEMSRLLTNYDTTSNQIPIHFNSKFQQSPPLIFTRLFFHRPQFHESENQ